MRASVLFGVMVAVSAGVGCHHTEQRTGASAAGDAAVVSDTPAVVAMEESRALPMSYSSELASQAGLAAMQASPVAAAPSIEIELVYTDAEDLKEWAEKAKAICEAWYPKICAELASEGFTPPTKTRITFDPAMRGVAHTSRGRIRASANYVRDHQDDYGMMVHELVHVVQSYPNRPKPAPSWIVEGIADYIRFYQYEPGTDRSRIDPEKASYRDSYRTTARFFDWVVQNHDKAIIQKLNSALRAGECDEEKAKELFGGDIDALWARFLDDKVRR